MCDLQKSGRDKAKRGQRVQDLKGGGRIQRGHKLVYSANVTDVDNQPQKIPMILRTLLSTASRMARSEAGGLVQSGRQYSIIL